MPAQWIALCVNTNPYWLPQTESTHRKLRKKLVRSNHNDGCKNKKRWEQTSPWASRKSAIKTEWLLCGICTAKTHILFSLTWHQKSLSNAILDKPVRQVCPTWDRTILSDAMSKKFCPMGFSGMGLDNGVWCHVGTHVQGVCLTWDWTGCLVPFWTTSVQWVKTHWIDCLILLNILPSRTMHYIPYNISRMGYWVRHYGICGISCCGQIFQTNLI
jgi:hypothetical protein